MKKNAKKQNDLFHHPFQSGIPPGPYIPGSVDEDDLYPVDFLEGKMDLRVVLPSMSVVRMQVERR